MSDNDDLIKRSDVYKAVDDWFAGRVPNLNIKDIPSADRPQSVCEHGEYCMCATCHYREDCSYCADCTEAQKQMHDLWSCTKYMRKEHLRKGEDGMKLYDQKFLCIGANERHGYTLNMVGDIHTLGEWLDILFPNKNARDYFEGDAEKSILEYLLANTGKRLERIKE